MNIDFHSNIPEVINHDLSKGIPFERETSDAIYHSHVLEHFDKSDGELFIEDCFRVLTPDGIIRIAVPDLETIASNYLTTLKGAIENENSYSSRYEWSLIELIDQMVRSKSGGEAKEVLSRERLVEEEYVYSRWGQEAKSLRGKLLEHRNDLVDDQERRIENRSIRFSGLRGRLARVILKPHLEQLEHRFNEIQAMARATEIGKFRLSGEVHQWMYDRYSLSKLLEKIGFVNINVTDAYSSKISGWSDINPDIDRDGLVRKPDSLFMEATKPRSS